MVSEVSVVPISTLLMQAEQGAQPLLERLDPPRRLVVVMALLALVLTGIVLVACVMIGGRWVRRMSDDGVRRTDTKQKRPSEPWRDTLRDALPDVEPSETISVDKKSGETRVDK